MRAYYATYNDKVYEVLGENTTPTELMNTATHTHCEVSHMRDRNAVNVKVLISNMDASAPSNKELFASVSTKLKNDKVTSIEKLSDVYRIYTEYTLIDAVSGTVVDDGIGVNEVKSNRFVFPLGINDENEFVSRLGININGKIENHYRDVRPFGVMRAYVLSRFVLNINRIYVIQLTMNAFSIQQISRTDVPLQKPRPYDPYDRYRIPPVGRPCGPDMHNYPFIMDPCVRDHGLKYSIYADMHHPSIPNMGQPRFESTTLRENDFIMVYDSLKDGVVFDSVVIDYKPTEVSVTIDLNLLDLLIAKEEDITAILEENKTSTETPGSDDQPSNPSTGDDSDTSGSTTEDPDPSTPSGSETGDDQKDTSEDTKDQGDV